MSIQHPTLPLAGTLSATVTDHTALRGPARPDSLREHLEAAKGNLMMVYRGYHRERGEHLIAVYGDDNYFHPNLTGEVAATLDLALRNIEFAGIAVVVPSADVHVDGLSGSSPFDAEWHLARLIEKTLGREWGTIGIITM